MIVLESDGQYLDSESARSDTKHQLVYTTHHTVGYAMRRSLISLPIPTHKTLAAWTTDRLREEILADRLKPDRIDHAITYRRTW